MRLFLLGKQHGEESTKSETGFQSRVANIGSLHFLTISPTKRLVGLDERFRTRC
jgi:hypothetical protein